MPVALALGGALLLLLVPALRRGLGRLLALAARTLAGLGALAALRAAGAGAVGVTLGVNLFNALTLGLLGLPGLALLLLFNWLTRL